MPGIDHYVDSGLAVITMADSVGGNLLHEKSLMALKKAFAASLSQKNTRAVLLRSNGDRFCLGMDLKLVQGYKGDKIRDKNLVASYSDLLLQIHRASKPVVALVSGEVKAGGVGLVAACDIVIASSQATFELSEVLWGLIPANVLPFLLALRMSPKKAGYLVLTAKKINAEEALSLHLVDEVFAPADLEKGARVVIKTLFRASPQALSEAKSFIRSLSEKKLEDACIAARDKLLALAANPEIKQAVSSFAEGELPSWYTKFRPKKPLIL